MSQAESPNPQGSYRVFNVPGKAETAGSGPSAIRVRRVLSRIVLTVATFFGLLIVATILVALSPTLSRSITAFFIESQHNAVPWNGTDPVNMLVVGLDRRPGQADIGNTDTLMVVSVDPASDTIRMFSVPRDLWVNIPGYGYDRVNSAYSLGGTPLMIRTVEGVVNLPIRYYAIIDFTNFQRVVTALGCVTIDVPHAINDPTYPALTGYGYAPLHIRAGTQRMCGRKALKYVRTRHEDPLGDLGRNVRQQQLLDAMKHQALTPGSIVRIPLILDSLRSAVDTNFPYVDLTYLARLVMTGSTHRITLNYNNNAVSNYQTPDGRDVLLGNWSHIHHMARGLFNGPSLAGAPVDVLNGSGISGQAAQAGDWLRASGFDVTKIGNATRQNYAKTTVIRNTAAGGGSFVARMAADLLQAPQISSTVPQSHAPVVVIVGQNWTNPVQS